jgi:hypothetical protein
MLPPSELHHLVQESTERIPAGRLRRRHRGRPARGRGSAHIAALGLRRYVLVKEFGINVDERNDALADVPEFFDLPNLSARRL